MKKTATVLTCLLLFLFLTSFGLLAQERANVTHDDTKSSDSIILGNPLPTVLDELPSESFEGTTFPPDGWKKVTNFGGTGWQRTAIGEEVPGFVDQNGDPSTLDSTPTDGGNAVALSSWATGDADGDFSTGQQTDQWLITPQIMDIQENDSLTFYLRYFSQFGDNLDVLISTTNADSTESFNTLVTTLSFSGEGPNQWIQYSFDLTDFVDSGSDIFIAFREHVNNTTNSGDALFLDLVEVISMVTGVAENSNIPHEFSLDQNYPNPFNPSTKISFSLAQSSEVTLKVYNLLGQIVATLVDGVSYPTGQHSVQFDATDLSNGVYFYRIEAGNFVDTKKMALVK